MSKSPQEKAEKLYIESGLEYPALAKKFKVSERTIRRWADAGNWRTKRMALGIASQSVAARLSEELDSPVYPRTVKAKYSELDSDRVLDDAIADLHASAVDAEVKSKEAAYATQIKLIQAKAQSALMTVELELKQTELELKKADLELKRRQLHPPNFKEWARLTLEYGYNLKEMVAELKELVGR